MLEKLLKKEQTFLKNSVDVYFKKIEILKTYFKNRKIN